MRILTALELEQVAGGMDTEGPEVVVQGWRSVWAFDTTLVVPALNFDNGSGTWVEGGGGSMPPDVVVVARAFSDADCAAEDIRIAIDQKPYSDRFEYAGIIYIDRATGQIRHSEVTTDYNQGLVTPPQYPPNSIPLGIVHSHPAYVIQDANNPFGRVEPSANPISSAQPSSIDMRNMYDTVQNMIALGYTADQANNYRIYIYFDGKIGEFAYKDQDWSNLAQGNQGQAIWAVKSNSYTPCQQGAG